MKRTLVDMLLKFPFPEFQYYFQFTIHSFQYIVLYFPKPGHSEKPLSISTNTADWRMTSDDFTEHLQSDKEFAHNATAQWEGPSVASQSITSHHPVTEARTVREVPVTDLSDVDTTDSVSQIDSTYISTTNQVRERTLLSVTSNGTSAYTEESNSSDAVSQTSSWEAGTSGATQGTEETVEDVSTLSEQTEPTFEDHNATNATQGHSLETEQSTLSHGTESQTGQSSVTGQTFEQVSDTDNPNSTPPLTVINRDEGVMNTTSVSGGTTYTETGDSVSSIPPFTSGEHNATSTSQQSRDSTVTSSLDTDASTEFSTGSVSSTGREELEGSPTHTVEETTIQGLTTTPLVPEDVATTIDDSFTKFLSVQPTFVPKTDDQTNTEVVPTSAMPATRRPQVTEEATDETSTVYILYQYFHYHDSSCHHSSAPAEHHTASQNRTHYHRYHRCCSGTADDTHHSPAYAYLHYWCTTCTQYI